MRKSITLINKLCVVAFALGGVLLSMLTSSLDGYSHWTKRLLYFTCQSNLWIGFTQLFLIFSIIRGDEKKQGGLYFFRYVFTVSITITAIVFCGLLGPNADASYRPWSLSSIMTHALAPFFAIVDFFVDYREIRLSVKGIGLSILPPAIYTVIASILCVMGVDFGRGDAFPYFFMNYFSPAGIFGFSNQMPFIIGSFYWIAMLVLLIISFAALYAWLSGVCVRRFNRGSAVDNEKSPTA